MLPDQIFDLIEDIAATSSKNDKQTLVTAGAQSPEFVRVLEATYNPLKTYGIRPARPTGPFGDAQVDTYSWQVIERLATRFLTGQAAIDAVQGEFSRLTEKSANLLWRIIRKDLRAGFSESTCNKAKKGMIPEFPYQRCCLPKDAKLSEFDWATGVLSQEKADGMFANLNVEAAGVVSLVSRQGSEFPMGEFADLAAEAYARLKHDTQSHGELLVERDGAILDREIGNGILNSVLSGGTFGPGERPIYLIWDQIPLASVQPKGRCDRKYVLRLADIVGQLKAIQQLNPAVRLIPTRKVHSLAEAYKHAGELMKQGKEGTVIKDPGAFWKDGTSKQQVKLKLEFNVDLVIKAVLPGEEGTRIEGRPGKFACETSDGLLKVNVTVKNEAVRDAVEANPEDWIGRILDVVANDIMDPSESSDCYSLFLPRMAEAGYRRDKQVADDLERVFAAKELAILGASLKEAALKEAA